MAEGASIARKFAEPACIDGSNGMGIPKDIKCFVTTAIKPKDSTESAPIRRRSNLPRMAWVQNNSKCPQHWGPYGVEPGGLGLIPAEAVTGRLPVGVKVVS